MTEREKEMDVFKIYRKDGTALKSGGEDVVIRKGEIDGTFMGQTLLTFSLSSPYPIPFEGGEYTEIDGNRYTLKFVPAGKKQARRGTSGESFVYENVVMQWEGDDFTRVEFLDYVKDDNQIHYSNMPTVYFFGTVERLIERIFANMERIFPGKWEYEIVGILSTQEKQITFQNIKCWEALTKVWEEFETLFFVVGHTIYFGDRTTLIDQTFCYGKGNGLKSIKPTTSADDEIITRLHVYGSQKNLPYRYYNDWNTGKELRVGVSSISANTGDYFLNIDCRSTASVHPFVYGAGMFTKSYRVEASNVEHYLSRLKIIVNEDHALECNVYVDTWDDWYMAGEAGHYQRLAIYSDAHINGGSYVDPTELADICQYIAANASSITEIRLTRYIDFTKCDASNVVKIGNSVVSQSMYLPNLMLPAVKLGEGEWYYKFTDGGFAETTQDEAEYKMVRHGNGNTLDIYLESIAGVEKFGVLEGTVTFDNDSTEGFVGLVDDENGIYPHLTDEDGHNAIVSATQLTDEGVFDATGDYEPKTFEVVVRPGFDPLDYIISTETPQISFKSGALIGRTFDLSESCKDNGDGTYTLTLNRQPDNSIGIAFPNANYNAKAGDTFVFLGIELPETYIEQAESRLLFKAGLPWLMNHDHSRYTIEPEVDDIFLARNPGVAAQLVVGNLMKIEDEDLELGDGAAENGGTLALPISNVKMKFGEDVIRQYTVTLTDTPDIKSDIIKRTVKAVEGRFLGGVGGVNQSDVTRIGDSRYLSKTKEDVAQELIRFLKGISFGGGNAEHGTQQYGISGDGVATLKRLLVESGVMSSLEVKDLTVTGLMEIFRLLIRQVNATAGDQVQTAAGSEIESVVPVWFDRNSGVWTEETQDRTPDGWKCKWRNSDGNRTTRNTWMKGDQALCHTDNLVESILQYNNYANRHYWRLVEEVGQDYVILSADNCEKKQELEARGEVWNKNTNPYNLNAASIPAPKDEIVQFGYQPQGDDFDVEGGEMKRNVGRMSIQWEGSDNDGPFKGMWAAVKDFTMPGKPHIIRDGREIIDPRIVEFVSTTYSYHNSENWVLVHNGVALPKTVDMGDWLSYFQRDGVVNAKPYERYYYLGCLFQCSQANDRCPIYFDENGEGRVSDGWGQVSGVLPSLKMKLWDTTLMKFVDEVSVSWGVVRTLECSLWKNYTERMTFGTVTTVNGMRLIPITNMSGWWLVEGSWGVERDSGKPLDDAAWNNEHRDFDGSIALYFGAEKNGIMTNDLNREGDGETIFTFSCEITNGTESMAFVTAMVV